VGEASSQAPGKTFNETAKKETMTMPEESLASRIEAVGKLTALFKIERWVHLGVTTVSLLMLLTSAFFLILRNMADPVTLTLMFGSSGLIAYSANRLLLMWDQAMKLLNVHEKDGGPVG
jgi:hypothetical protein